MREKRGELPKQAIRCLCAANFLDSPSQTFYFEGGLRLAYFCLQPLQNSSQEYFLY